MQTLRAQDTGGGLHLSEWIGLAPSNAYWVSPLLLLLYIHVPSAKSREAKSGDVIAGTELSLIGS